MTTLTRGQIGVLTTATIPMIAVGIGGAIGTYANAASVLHREETALGVVAAGEGATLVAALVMLGLTMLGQPAPLTIRAALWLLPATASATGTVIAPTLREAVVFAVTPMAMTVSAEGLALLARRIVVKTTGTDVEAQRRETTAREKTQRRNAATMRHLAYHRARAANHPDPKARKESELKAWRLAARVGTGDVQLGSELVEVQRERLTEGADAALADMLTGAPARPELPPAQPAVSPEPDPEPTDFETTVATALTITRSEPHTTLPDPLQPPAPHLPTPADQVISREPVLSRAEPIATAQAEPTREPSSEPEIDEREQQITELATRLRAGERLTKNTAAELLGVSPATAGRRLKDARDRINDGTGMYL